MLANRRELLDVSAAANEYDNQAVRRLADAQGKLLAELIVWKESLKKQLRSVLSEQQQPFIDDLIAKIIATRAPALLPQG
ncbi:MAG: hypothetical protein ACU837_14365 [Gammaproteobacteria bacterium]